MDTTIEVAGLRKRYGQVTALDGLSFLVKPGEVTGFVGPNGAGKSTTMRVILGLDDPDEGTALVGGQRYASLRHPLSHLGALLDADALQPSRRGRDHLLWLAHSQGLGTRRVNQVIDLAGLGSAGRRRAGGYSLGMRQRLGIAAALLADPPMLMLDEPFNGLDPEGIVWMRELLRSLAAQGRAVLVSSHLMSELQDNADHLLVIGRGQAARGHQRGRADGRRVQGPGHGQDDGPHRGDDRAHPRGRHRRRQRPRHAGRLRAERGPDRRAARQPRGGVLRARRPSGDAGGGLHGADQGRGRVPRAAPAPGRTARRPWRPPGVPLLRRPGRRPAGDRARHVPPAGPVTRNGFWQLLRSEWTKFRTVRGWPVTLAAIVALTALLPSWLASTATSNDPVKCTAQGCQVEGSFFSTGPSGTAVIDSFTFVHQPVGSDGSITARVDDLHGSGHVRRHSASARRPPPSPGPRRAS